MCVCVCLLVFIYVHIFVCALHFCVCASICICICLCKCQCVYMYVGVLFYFSYCSHSAGIQFSLGRWGSRRRCCTYLCFLRGPSLRPAAHTPHHLRPNAGSHCWRHSRNSDQHPEQWRLLLPVTDRGHTHWQLEHGQNCTNSCLLVSESSLQQKVSCISLHIHHIVLIFKTVFFKKYVFILGWVVTHYYSLYLRVMAVT